MSIVYFVVTHQFRDDTTDVYMSRSMHCIDLLLLSLSRDRCYMLARMTKH